LSIIYSSDCGTHTDTKTQTFTLALTGRVLIGCGIIGGGFLRDELAIGRTHQLFFEKNHFFGLYSCESSCRLCLALNRSIVGVVLDAAAGRLTAVQSGTNIVSFDERVPSKECLRVHGIY
jgi:hypothetical protein